MSVLEFSLRLGVALVLGAIIGYERSRRQGLAGIRTNALVACGAAQFVMLSGLLAGGDPTRIAAQVVSGVGFLGAGVILREGGFNVRGLNTAATLWGSAAVGSLAGAGFVLYALPGTLAIMVANLVLRNLEMREKPPKA
ncbi:MgtC/SapB family protein [Meiothermus granaticius]|uniref:MgtC family protein n=1 Tax=Meiothermus granaticius NBRC 107808 TaxID=1227551 RepID=A0A399FAR1_9DEIN|nr:MgtC/SapB family protein [Meiothermus granaticius]MCL6526085.1 MgtC/SapB family protein [Thermaceae bacterium]RIH92002.1 MgtC family protein [Meiothermus granaticius NBRC 107808]